MHSSPDQLSYLVLSGHVSKDKQLLTAEMK